jgi:BirA family biotin operon repressor/biotin-[acetyl-CoA-carboxylase] ligase
LQNAVRSFDLASVRARFPGRRIDYLETCASTMLEARQSLEPGRIVAAGGQTAGIGRHGRTWLSPSGEGLYVSLVLPPASQPVIMLALGLAVAEAFRVCSAPQPDLRWPNDVILRGRKCAGVLAQLEPGAMIAGIGVNVSQTYFPGNLDTPATSLLREGAHVSREDLLVALIHAVDAHLPLSSGEIIRRFTKASTYAAGRRVQAEADGRRIQGTTCGLDASGFLVVREDSGMETTILAGGVRPCS